jgi:ribosomal protein S27E
MYTHVVFDMNAFMLVRCHHCENVLIMQYVDTRDFTE